jgi:hypothetical protein
VLDVVLITIVRASTVAVAAAVFSDFFVRLGTAGCATSVVYTVVKFGVFDRLDAVGRRDILITSLAFNLIEFAGSIWLLFDMRKKAQAKRNRKPKNRGKHADPLLDNSIMVNGEQGDAHSQLINDYAEMGDENDGEDDPDMEHSSFSRLLLLAKPESGDPLSSSLLFQCMPFSSSCLDNQ